MKIILALLSSILLISCSSTPKIDKSYNFSVEKYFGKWYELKRFDHGFEKGLKAVTAEYKIEENGKIFVFNRGIDSQNKESEFRATAKQTDVPNFFKIYPKVFPLIGVQYNVAWVDDGYNYAIVTSSSYKYLWFLSREQKIPLDIYDGMIKKAKELGFDTEKLIDGQ